MSPRRRAERRRWTRLSTRMATRSLRSSSTSLTGAPRFQAVKRAADHFGSLDVVINNAGYGHFGMVEELTEDDWRSQLETNFFGAVWVTQAALPIMRAQGRGHVIQVSSLGGVTAFPAIGAYHASKWALEGRPPRTASATKNTSKRSVCRLLDNRGAPCGRAHTRDAVLIEGHGLVRRGQE